MAISTYNLVLIYAAHNQIDQALSLLREAVDGMPAFQLVLIDKDPDLNILHADSRFTDLVAYARERAAVLEKRKSSSSIRAPVLE